MELSEDTLKIIFNNFFPKQLTPLFYVCKSWSKVAIEQSYSKLVLHENGSFLDILNILLHIFDNGFYPYKTFVKEVIILAYPLVPTYSHDKTILNKTVYQVFSKCSNILHFSWNRNRMLTATLIKLVGHWPYYSSLLLKSLDDPLELQLLQLVNKSLKCLWFRNDEYQSKSLANYISVFKFPNLLNLHITNFSVNMSLINKTNFPMTRHLSIDNSVVEMLDVIQESNIRQLSLLNINELTPLLLNQIALQCPFLTYLEISDANWNAVKAQQLNQQQFRFLTSLKLIFNEICDSNLEFELPELQSLSIVNATLTKADCTTISQLTKLKMLTLKNIASDSDSFSIIIYDATFDLEFVELGGFLNFKVSNPMLSQLYKWDAKIIIRQ